MTRSKGVTPVIATALLLGITVAAGATLYMTVQDSAEQGQQTPDLQDADFNVESCWGSSSATSIAVRNTGDKSVNLSQVQVMTNFSNVDYSFDQDVSEPGDTVTLTIQENLERRETVTLTSSDIDLNYRCFEIADAQPQQPDPPEDQPTWILEEGGQSITSLTMGGSGDDLSITGYEGNLCIGSGCDHTTGSPTDLDTDDRVNKSGDEISGSLETSEVTWSGNLCIGENCPQPTEGTQDSWLTESDTIMEGPLAIRYLTSDTNLCMGENC